jgi:hypothetical protein
MKTATGKTEEKSLSMHLMLNFSAFNAYKAPTLNDYTKKLESMNLSDLQSHAIKFGIRANCDRKRTTKSLIDQYIKDKAKFDLAVLKEQKSREVEVMSEKEAAYKAPFN